jgi:hypothetical protein
MELSYSENIILRNTLANPAYLENAKPEFFKNNSFGEIHKLAKKFWDKYNEIPSREQMKESAKMEGVTDRLELSEIDAIYNIELSSYQEDWLTETTECFIEYKNLTRSAVDAVQYIQKTPVTAENIKEVINTFKNIVVERNNLDFSFDEGLDFFNPESHKQLSHNTFKSGYNYIDTVLGGGFSAKSLYVFMGMPKVGKCFLGYTKVRNKCTGEILEIRVDDLYEKLKSENDI